MALVLLQLLFKTPISKELHLHYFRLTWARVWQETYQYWVILSLFGGICYDWVELTNVEIASNQRPPQLNCKTDNSVQDLFVVV